MNAKIGLLSFVIHAIWLCGYNNGVQLVASQSTTSSAANVATWLKMTNVGGFTGTPSTRGTVPKPACDHSQVKMTPPMRTKLIANGIIGQGVTDAIVTWGGGSSYNPDFFENLSVWLGYRSGEAEITWVVLADFIDDITVWPEPRAGHAVQTTSDGDMIVFSGSLEDDDFLDDMWIFNMTTLAWVNIFPGSYLGISAQGPIGRGWTQLTPIHPTNASFTFNTSLNYNPFNPEVNTYLLHNGVGTYDGDVNSVYSRDLDDNWILQLKYTSGKPVFWWQKADDDTGCSDLVVSCTDSISPSDQDEAISPLATRVADLASTKVRPTEFAGSLLQLISESTQLLNRSTFLYNNWTHSALPHVDDGTCVFQCSDVPRPPGFPPRTEGHRSEQLGNLIFTFGGYSCVEGGLQTLGGPDCYRNLMWIFHIDTYQWETLSPPDTTNPNITEVEIEQANIWPLPRAYHTTTLIGTKLYIIGGGYEDDFSVFTFFNDVNVFNTITRLWEPITVQGSAPMLGWSSAGNALGSDIWYSWGCTSFAWYSDVHLLLVNSVIQSDNCAASGFENVTAGTPSSFLIQTRSYNTTGSGANTRVVFGDAVVWGVGLVEFFDVRIVGIGNPNNPAGFATQGLYLANGVVTEDENGGGLYHVSYTAESGHTLQIYVNFDGQSIPGSPFTVSMSPTQPTSEHSYVTSAIAAIRDGVSPLSVQLTDEYANEIYNGGAGGNFSVSVKEGDNAPTDTPFNTLDFGNGTYLIEYQAPDASEFELYIRFNGKDILDSPFQMQGLDGLGISSGARTAMLVLTILCIFFVVFLMSAVAYCRHGAALKVATPLFVEFMLFGALLGLFSVIVLTANSDSACRAFPFLLGLGFVILLGSLYIKTYRLMVIFKQKTLRVIKLTLGRMTQIMAVLVAVELLYNIIWVAVAPAQLTVVNGSPSPLTYNKCDGSNFTIWAGFSFGYKGVFLFYGVFLSVMTKGLPSAYNESGWIVLSIYNIAFVSIVVLPVIYGLSSQDTLTAVFVLTCLAIIWVVMASSCALVLPKLYYISRGIQPDKRLVPGSQDSAEADRKAAARAERRARQKAEGNTDSGPSSPKSTSDQELQGGGLMVNLNLHGAHMFGGNDDPSESNEDAVSTTVAAQPSSRVQTVVIRPIPNKQPTQTTDELDSNLSQIVVSGTPTTVRSDNILLPRNPKPIKNTVVTLST